MTIEITAGSTIERAIKEAIARTSATGDTTDFDFNGTKVVVGVGDTDADAIQKRWSDDMDAASKAYRESPEYKERQRLDAEELERKTNDVMRETAQTEAEMRETKSPWPHTMKQLTDYVQSVTDRQHDYGTCCYAMSLAASAAFNYVAHQLGSSGFQSGCADLDFLRRSRGLKGPFMIIKGEDALYPQYDLHEKLSEALVGWQPWLKEEAAKNLAESPTAHPAVIAHWRKLAD